MSANMISDIRGDRINSISTKFYYEKAELRYQILLNYGEQHQLLYRDFGRFDEYSRQHNRLIDAMNQNSHLDAVFQVA